MAKAVKQGLASAQPHLNEIFWDVIRDTLFCSVQHPGEGSSLDDPSSTWAGRAIPQRPSVIAVEKTDSSRVIGS